MSNLIIQLYFKNIKLYFVPVFNQLKILTKLSFTVSLK